MTVADVSPELTSESWGTTVFVSALKYAANSHSTGDTKIHLNIMVRVSLCCPFIHFKTASQVIMALVEWYRRERVVSGSKDKRLSYSTDITPSVASHPSTRSTVDNSVLVASDAESLSWQSFSAMTSGSASCLRKRQVHGGSSPLFVAKRLSSPKV